MIACAGDEQGRDRRRGGRGGLERAWYDGGTLPAKPVVLSFDDGYRPQFTYTQPELKRHGWPGVLNLKAEGSDLYESNVKAMIDAGWELAAHTIHHLDLTTLDAEQLKEEVAGSREILRREYGVRAWGVRWLSALREFPRPPVAPLLRGR